MNERHRALLKLYEARDAIAELGLRGQPIACKRGCSACCYQQVAVTLREAEMLSEHGGADACVASIELWERSEGRLTDYYYGKHPCPYLDGDGLCSVYEVRPLACRMNNSDNAGSCADPRAGVRQFRMPTDPYFMRMSGVLSDVSLGKDVPHYLMGAAVLHVMGRLAVEDLRKYRMS